MHQTFFSAIENEAHNTEFPLNKILDELAFDKNGLLPTITQDATTKEVLMLAYMNREALEHTLFTKRVTYWSRSRSRLWTKGETSGNTQTLVSLSFDCDGDAILCLVNQNGPACHTGRSNCFYLHAITEAPLVEAPFVKINAY